MRSFILGTLNMLNSTDTIPVFMEERFSDLIIQTLQSLFYPLLGLMTDMCIGRYRMIVGSTVVSFTVSIVLVTIVTLLKVYDDVLLGYIVFSCTLLLFLAHGCFESVLLAFNIDQLIGASGDELSATLYWHIFGEMLADSILRICQIYADNLYVWFAIGNVSVTTSLCLHLLCNRWIDTTPQYYNPLKLIFRVLNYARKYNYPRNRSALTYWEDNYPSRFDLGMDKYGGPFTVEQVEDVKTFLRLLLILTSIFGLGLCISPNLIVFYISKSKSLIDMKIIHPLVVFGMQYLICCIFILLYQLIIFPCFSRWIPSMLRRISIGLLFTVLTLVCCIAILCVGHVTFTSAPSIIHIDYKWFLIPEFTLSIAVFLVQISSLEFIVAQSPKSFRGLMVGLWYAMYGFGLALSTILSNLIYLKENSKLVPLFSSHGVLYLCVCELFVVSLICISFILIARYYKYRVRENLVPVNQLAEEYYERFLSDSSSNDDHQ